jgi:hypothetical protein
MIQYTDTTAVPPITEIGVTNASPPIEYARTQDLVEAVAAAHRRAPKADVQDYHRMGVAAMPFLALDQLLLFVKEPANVAVDGDTNAAVAAYFRALPGIYDGSQNLGLPTFAAAINTTEIRCARQLQYFLDAVNRSLPRVRNEAQPSILHMVGAYVGSMFAQAGISTGVKSNAAGDFKDVEASGWNVAGAGAAEHNLSTRMAVVIGASHMIDAGIALASRLTVAEVQNEKNRGLLVCGLYFAYLECVSRVKAAYDQNGALASTEPNAVVLRRLNGLKILRMDIDGICSKALVAARACVQRAIPNVAALQAFYPTAQNTAWHRQKLNAVTRGAAHGMPTNRLIPLAIAISMEDIASVDILFDVIEKSMGDLDSQATLAYGTHTASEFDSSGGLDLGAISSTSASIGGALTGEAAHARSELPEEQPRNTQAGSSGSRLMLGSILLDSSELQASASAAAATTTITTMGGGEMTEASSAISPTSSEKQQAKKTGGSTQPSASGKAQFKKVQAKLL